jgi:hypothetical protein
MYRILLVISVILFIISLYLHNKEITYIEEKNFLDSVRYNNYKKLSITIGIIGLISFFIIIYRRKKNFFQMISDKREKSGHSFSNNLMKKFRDKSEGINKDHNDRSEVLEYLDKIKR